MVWYLRTFTTAFKFMTIESSRSVLSIVYTKRVSYDSFVMFTCFSMGMLCILVFNEFGAGNSTYYTFIRNRILDIAT